MIDSAVKEVNGFLSIKRWEDALKAVEMQPAKHSSREDIQIEAYLLHNLKYFARCRDLCLRSSEGRTGDFDLKFILNSCENVQKAKASLLSEITSCRRADRENMTKSIGFLLGVFCDIKDVTYYLTSVLSAEKAPVYTYLLACIYRISGKLHDSIVLLESIKSSYPDAETLLKKVRIEFDAFRKLGRFGANGKMGMPGIPDMNGEDMMVRGFWSIAEKDYQSAFRYLAEAIRLDSSLAVCWYYVGKLQNMFGARERGDKCFRKFLEFFPYSSGYYKAMVFSPGITDERREEYYRKWIGCLPSDPASWMAYLSWLYSRKDFFSVQIIASEILDSYEEDWFVPKDNPMRLVYSGILSLAVGRTAEATAKFTEAMKFEPYKTVALLGIGAANDAQGVIYDALNSYEKSMADPKAESISKYMLSNVYLKRKNYKKAFTTIDEVLSKHPDSTAAVAKKAEVYLKLSDIKGFRKYTSELSEKHMSPELHVLTAMVDLKEMDSESAEAELRKACSERPDSYTLLFNLAVLLIAREKYDEGMEIADRMLEMSFDPVNFLVKGYLLLKKESFKEAYGMFCDYLSFCPFDFKGWLLSGIAALRLGMVDAARLSFEKSLLYSDGKPVYRLNLALLYASIGMYDEALKYVDISPRNDSYYSLVSVWLNAVAGKYQESLSAVESLLDDQERGADAFNIKAYSLFTLGRMEEAAAVLDKALERYSGNRMLLYNKAFLDLHRKKYAEAGEILKDLISDHPDYYKAWLAEAILQWINNDEQAVIKAITGAKALRYPGFKTWLKTASAMKDPLSTISFAVDVELNFYVPEMFSLGFSDPIGFFGFNRLDAVFNR